MDARICPPCSGRIVVAWPMDERPLALRQAIRPRHGCRHRGGAVTFWGKRESRPLLEKALALLDQHYCAPDRLDLVPSPGAKEIRVAAKFEAGYIPRGDSDQIDLFDALEFRKCRVGSL